MTEIISITVTEMESNVGKDGLHLLIHPLINHSGACKKTLNSFNYG